MPGHPSTAAVESTGLWVDRCVTGDEAAWRWLHRRYYQTALNVLRRLGVQPQQLEDACQDVFLDVFRSLPKFRQEAEFSTWLYRLCIGHARVARRRAKVKALLSTWLAEMGTEGSPVPFDESAANERILRALDVLSEAERVVFVLFELQGVSGKEIAQIVKCPESTVFRRLHEARKRFVDAVQAGGLP
jgi:RNA polymerase sigma-70 factor (ECF subfamily)